ncbi:uncharacterized protein LOC135834228 [Planococcus citri]|uniref:uncharacterized protein LOC135834228 n=1 Tax=Planococcus citri TaxID=170843 RepID=UPI0031F8FCE5
MCPAIMNQKMIRPNFAQELKKMIRQLRGSENIFDYKSTVANQLYLLYCFSGNIYFTDKISKRVKFLCYSVILCQLLISYSIGLTYFRDIMSASNKNFTMMFDVSSVFGCYQIIEFGFPLISYFYGDRIETMIDHVDAILSSECTLNQNEIMAHAKEKCRLFMGLFAIFCLVYLSAGSFEVILFFDEAKIKNYLYYAAPPPLIGQIEGLLMYFIFNCVLASSYILASLKVWSVLSIVLYWNIICCDQLVSLRDGLGTKMRDFAESQESWNTWNVIFERNVANCAKRFQNIMRLVDYLRGFTETIASFYTLASFAFSVLCLHVCVLVRSTYCFFLFMWKSIDLHLLHMYIYLT